MADEVFEIQIDDDHHDHDDGETFEFYCTAGRGTEKFVKKEIQNNKKRCTNVEIEDIDGKVFFSLKQDVSINDLTALKTVERVFLKVCHKETPKMVRWKEKKTILAFLANHLLDGGLWKNIERCLASLSVTERTGCSLAKKPKLEKDEGSLKTFRVSCRSSGTTGRLCPGQDMARSIGVGLSRILPWKVNLRNPDVEVCIHINDTYITVGIPLTRIPVSRRPYVKYPGLRSTVSYIMADLLRIQTGDIVLDPMCGKATILIEAAHVNSDIVCIGCDLDQQQLSIARQNVEHAELGSVIQLVRIDAKGIPFGMKSVDKVVCDLPFGIKFKFDTSADKFFQSILTEIDRVLKCNGLAVLLVGTEVKQCVYRLLHVNRVAMKPTDNNSSVDEREREEENSYIAGACSDTDIPADAIGEKESLVTRKPDAIDANKHRTTDNVRVSVDKQTANISSKDFNNDVLTSSNTLTSTYTSLLKSGNIEEFVDTEPVKTLLDEQSSNRDSINEDFKTSENSMNLNQTVANNDIACTNQSDHSEETSDDCSHPVSQADEAVVQSTSISYSLGCRLSLCEEHYVKLGDTDAFICMLKKI